MGADYRDRANNQNISALFNAIIFARACEDLKAPELLPDQGPMLLRSLELLEPNTEINLRVVVENTLSAVGFHDSLSAVIDLAVVNSIGDIDYATAAGLLRDFYKPSTSPYDFNFAWMSKHALSRIYERYVSLLDYPEEADQLSFISPTPLERPTSKLGSVYTPQFVAGFFARYSELTNARC